MSISQRKFLMTVLRVRIDPDVSVHLQQSYHEFSQQTIVVRDLNLPSYATAYTGKQVIDLIRPSLGSPILCSILSSAIRSVPSIDEEDVRSVIRDAVWKELEASQRGPTSFPRISFPFLDPDFLSYNISPDIPPNDYINGCLRLAFKRWLIKVSRTTLFPKPRFKSLGRTSTLRFRRRVFGNSYSTPARLYTTCHLEQYYMETGFELSGPCELRYAWKYNDVKPRIYYAMGSSAYFASRYLSKPFYQLMEIIRCTNPQTRYSFSRFPLLHVQEIQFLIYDYSSFTSLLSSFSNFIRHLALFSKTTTVRVFDTHYGFVDKTIGDMLDLYNNTCNQGKGEFEVHRFENELGQEISAICLSHETAGMLGVFGNIAGSTVLHGCIGIQIANSENMFNAIGDDAALAWDSSTLSLDEVKSAIRTIGDIADEKFIVWEESERDSSYPTHGWHYVKRPITVIDGVVDQKWMPDFPIIASITGSTDSFHTPKKPTVIERRRLLIKQVSRLFDSMRLHLNEFDPYDTEIVLDMLRGLYRRLSLPINGSFPFRYATAKDYQSYPDNYLCIPCLNAESVMEGWFKTLSKHNREQSLFTLPVYELGCKLEKVDLRVGLEFSWYGGQMLGLMEKLGVFEVTPLYEERFLTESNLEYYEYCVLKKVRRVYKVVVVQDYPLLHQVADQIFNT